MHTTIHRLKTQEARLRAEHARYIRAFIEGMNGPEDAKRRILAAIDRETAAEERWTFVMISSYQFTSVQKWLAANAQHPKYALLLWGEVFNSLDMNTGEIVATREELALGSGVPLTKVSEVMGDLAKINAISKLKQGRHVRYFLNPNVGTHIPTASARERARGEFGRLRLVASEEE